jgi:3'-5' exonuclease
MSKRPFQTIVIDIETLPTEIPFEEKLGWETEEEYRRTALDGNFGRLLCIGYTREFSDGRPVEEGCFGWNEATGRFASDEAEILRDFWNMLDGFDQFRDVLVGHNITDFDLPFIVKRSVVRGVRPTVDFSFARYRSRPLFDTMRIWDCWSYKNRTSLEKLALILGLPSPKNGDITGGNLCDAYLAGRFREIREYCLRDVRVTRQVFRRMQFLDAKSSLRPKTKSMAVTF